ARVPGLPRCPAAAAGAGRAGRRRQRPLERPDLRRAAGARGRRHPRAPRGLPPPLRGPRLRDDDPADRRRPARGGAASVTSGAGTTIRVHVRLFAMQRELAGTRSVDLALATGAIIEDAWSALVGRFPVLAPGRPAVRFARNGSYAPADTSLGDGDEVAMIPPVSGGAAGGREDLGDEVRIRILELREAPFDGSILAEL